jgi:hypothetical protein
VADELPFVPLVDELPFVLLPVLLLLVPLFQLPVLDVPFVEPFIDEPLLFIEPVAELPLFELDELLLDESFVPVLVMPVPEVVPLDVVPVADEPLVLPEPVLCASAAPPAMPSAPRATAVSFMIAFISLSPGGWLRSTPRVDTGFRQRRCPRPYRREARLNVESAQTGIRVAGVETSGRCGH